MLRFQITRIPDEFAIELTLQDEMPVKLTCGEMQELENALVAQQLVMINEGWAGDISERTLD